ITKGKRVIARIPKWKGLYRLSKSAKPSETANTALVPMGIDDLHRRMGHISMTTIQNMLKNGRVAGMKLDDTKPTFCNSCVKAKLTRMPLPKVRSGQRDAKVFGDRIHSDLWGQSQVEAISGESYIITFTD